ncbi:MAG: hypothetical protein ACI90V_014377, partial [Bacillariaceae sp.]
HELLLKKNKKEADAERKTHICFVFLKSSDALYIHIPHMLNKDNRNVICNESKYVCLYVCSM